MTAYADAFDVVVVGGGMVGAALALALAPTGARVALLEARTQQTIVAPGYDDRATALSAGSQRILAAVGLWESLTGHSAAIHRVHVSEQGRIGVAWLEAAELALEALGWVVENPRLIEDFESALDRQAAITRFQPATLAGFEDDGAGVTVTLETADGPRTLRTGLLVGADGARSVVRERIGVEAETHPYGQTAIVANLTPSKAHDGVAFERFTREGPLAFLPLTRGRCAIVWSVPDAVAEARMAWPEDAFATHINGLFGARLGTITRVGRRQAWPLTRTLASRQRVGRVVLVGNAAHSLHPIAGQGLNLSLRDVAALAEAMVAGADDAALVYWEESRRADQLRVARFTDGLNTLFLPDFPLLGAARGLGLGSFGLAGPARRLLARYGAGVGAPLPRLARGVPLT